MKKITLVCNCRPKLNLFIVFLFFSVVIKVQAQCSNLLTNGGFEDITTGLINGNNLLADISPWVINDIDDINLVQVDGAGGYNYPIPSPEEDANGATGVGILQRYFDMKQTANTIYQTFTLSAPATITYSGYFSTRDDEDALGRISIYNGVGTGGTITDDTGILTIVSNGDSTNTPWVLVQRTVALAVGTYSYVMYMNNRGNFDEASVIVDTPPSPPGISTPVTYCVGSTASALTATGSNLLWYTVSSGGTGSATAPTPSTATAGNTSYYVSQTVGSCESPRSELVVTVNAVPSAPGVSTPVTYCVGATASALTATGSNLLWYTVSSGGTGSGTAPTPSTATAGNTSYYVSQTVGSCESPRSELVVTVNAVPSAPGVSTPVTYCVGATASALTATGSNLLWYTVSSGGTGSATAPTPSTTAPGNTSYYVSQSVGGCESSRSEIVVTVNAAPMVPTAASFTQPTCTVPSGTIVFTVQSGVEYSIGGAFQSSNIFSGLVSNTYTLTIRNTTTNCTMDATSTVTINSFVCGEDDTIIFDGNSGNISINVVDDNDTFNGIGANLGIDVVINTVTDPDPSDSIILNPTTGRVTVAANTTPGIYTIDYRLCNTALTLCDDVRITITVLNCSNLLTNGGFEDITTGIVNGNNVNVNISPWILGPGSSNNIVQLDGPGGYNYPHPSPQEDANPATGAGVSQHYFDITTGTNNIYQTFILNAPATITYSGYFSTRENNDGQGSISIHSGIGTAGAIIDGSGTLTIASNGDSTNTPWFLVERTVALTAGTYSYVVNMDNDLNFDEASVLICGDVVANDDSVCIHVVTGGNSVNVVSDNDTFEGVSATLGTDVTITAVSDPNLTDGVSFNASTGQITVAAGTTSGSYTIGYTLCNLATETLCDTATITVIVTSAPRVTTPVTYCTGDTASALTATGSNLLWYTVASGGTGSATAPTPSITTPENTSYYVSQTTGGCESLRSEIVVSVNVLPTINITNPPACLTGSTTYSLEVTVSSGNVTSTSGIVSNISGNIWSIAEITSETDIDVTVTGINGCQEMISVDAPLCITDVGITINTGISPNGDGVNDEFRIIGLNDFPQNTLQIFNRWGVKVFERDRYEQPGVKLFDGISYGRVTVQEDEKLPVGTYYYVLNYQDTSGTIMSKAGYFYITR